jgi:hypothetical protein
VEKKVEIWLRRGGESQRKSGSPHKSGRLWRTNLRITPNASTLFQVFHSFHTPRSETVIHYLLIINDRAIGNAPPVMNGGTLFQVFQLYHPPGNETSETVIHYLLIINDKLLAVFCR